MFLNINSYLNRTEDKMPKELKKFCLKNWDLGAKWGARSILKNNNVEEDN